MDSEGTTRAFSRRRFLSAIAASSVATALLAACSAPAASPTAAPAAPKPTSAAPAPAPAKPADTPAAKTGSTEAPKPAATQAPAAKPAAAPSGKLTIGMAITQATMDPSDRVSGNGLVFILPVYEALTWVESGGKVVPMLATSWEQTNPTTWRFKLREGVKFHNGDDFTAEDVKFTIDRGRDAANRLAAAGRLSNVAEVRVVDKSTVDIVSKSPDVVVPPTMAQIFIGSAKYFASAGVETYRSKAVGTGPWRMTEFKPNETYLYDSFTGYWGPKPPIKELSIKIVPEVAPRVAALLTGELDVVESVSVDQVEQIKNSGRAKTVSSLQGSISNFLLNYGEPHFADKRVRQALNYAVDKEAIAQAVRKGYAKVVGGQLIGPDCFGYNPNLKAYEYNVDKARQLMTEAGFANGFETEMHVTQNPFTGKDVGEAVTQFLSRLNIKLNIRIPENAVWLDEFYGRRPRPGMLAMANNYDPQYDARFIFNWFTKDSAANPPFFSGPIPEEFARLWDQQNAEVDRTKREQQLQRMSAIMYDDAPSIFLWQNEAIYGLRNEVDWKPGPGVILNFREATRTS